MQRIIIFLLVVLTAATIFTQNTEQTHKALDIDTNLVLTPEPKHSRINQMVTTLLANQHFKRTKIDDSLSSIIFDNLINSLDNNKLYFFESDIEKFETSRNLIDDYLLTGNPQIAFDIFNTFKQRLNERMRAIARMLQSEFDYSIDEYLTPNREKEPWAADVKELDEVWRLRLKNDALNKKLAGEEWEKTSSSLLKRFQNFHKAILQYNSEDVFQLYMNAFASAIDPHSNYFSPITSENFNISMSRSLEGIGATLRSVDDYTSVVEIVAGGPADKSKSLFPDDRIVAVGQGEDGEMVDVIGWRVDDVVQLIRGKKGTTVKLSILRAGKSLDMPTDEIKIVRDKVTLEEQSAKSEIVYLNEDGQDYKIGVVSIPAFYIDFKARSAGDPDYKSTTKDVKKILLDLQKENVDGVVVDLRNNGGGSLQEAIELTGLFIADGPVVQVKDSRGVIDVGTDPDPYIVYEGPLAVLLNRYSASASEIFSGAIQDYERGVILGERTFGKGTVQNLIDLGRYLPLQNEKVGNLKLTIAKYYRITGSSTQLKGVIPDIEFPSAVDSNESGESAYPNALSWEQIQSTQFETYNGISDCLPELMGKYKERIAKNIEFNYLLEDIEEFKANKLKTTFSLNEEIRKRERETAEEKKKLREEERQKQAELKIVDKKEISNGSSKIDDPILEESLRILSDFISIKMG